MLECRLCMVTFSLYSYVCDFLDQLRRGTNIKPRHFVEPLRHSEVVFQHFQLSPFFCSIFLHNYFHAIGESARLTTLSSSLGMTRPQPCSQGTGLLGLCSQDSLCDARQSSFTITLQPNWALSHDIWSRASKLRRMRGTGFSWAVVMDCLSTGHVCCWDSHCLMQPWQNACSHWGACDMVTVNIYRCNRHYYSTARVSASIIYG